MPALKKLPRLVRDAFRLEPLEPRVLLSADPVLGAAQAILIAQADHDKLLVGAYDFDPADSFWASSGASPEPSFDNPVSTVRILPLSPAPSVVFDLAKLTAGGGFVGGSMQVAANEVLAGSGSVNIALLNDGTVSPGYSPGMINVASYTQTAGGVLQIEIGGLTPANGDQALNHFDQINVSGLASLDGALAVSLINGFKPSEGDAFEIMTFGTVGGRFNAATGLLAAGDGIYFEVVQTASNLRLVAHEYDISAQYLVDALGAGTMGSDLASQLGEWLNFDYFPLSLSVEFHGSISLFDGLALEGDFSLAYERNASLADPVTGGQGVFEIWRLGLDHGSGLVGPGVALDPAADLGLKVDDITLGLAFVNSMAGDYGWALGQGSTGLIGLQGIPGLTLHAQDFTIGFAAAYGETLAHAANQANLDLTQHPIDVTHGAISLVSLDDDGTAGQFLRVGGTGAQLAVSDFATVSGDFSFYGAVSGSNGSLTATGLNVSASLAVAPVELTLSDATFAMFLADDGVQARYALHAVGAVALQGIPGLTLAGVVALDVNRTGAQVVDFGAAGSNDFGTTGVLEALDRKSVV